jgi:hypothetical protein
VSEIAVEQDAAMVDHNHALAERDDVRHVVARQQDARTVPAVVFGDE